MVGGERVHIVRVPCVDQDEARDATVGAPGTQAVLCRYRPYRYVDIIDIIDNYLLQLTQGEDNFSSGSFLSPDLWPSSCR